MTKRIDFTGRKFGYLTPLSLTPKIKGVRQRKWICRCDACNQECELESSVVRSARFATCGCRPRLTISAYKLAHGMTGQCLVKTMPTSLSDAPDICYFLEPSGKAVPRADAEAAIEAHELVPLADGLFPDTAQTWVRP